MAMRRTRIKGLANIPQRRKATELQASTESHSPGDSNLESLAKEEHTVHKIEVLETYKRSVKSSDESAPDTSIGEWQKVVKTTESSNNDRSALSVLGITQLPIAQNDTDGEEVSRPAPSSSPTKVNRARIKAVPCLGQRRASFSIGSASESEDESKKNGNAKRIRNDSVCSSVQGNSETNIATPTTLTASQSSPQKKTEFNSVIQRKCRRTDQSRRLAEARREFQMKFRDQKPDRQKLTMMDLIFYNPSSSPMASQKRKRNESVTEAKTEEDIDEPPPSDEQQAKKSEEESDDDVPAPQITIGPDGEIVVDAKSLYIVNKDVKRSREALKNSSLINGDEFDTKYGVVTRPKRAKDWSKKETLRFYKALNTIGTDFSLMAELFPDRSRREIKMKFKKEERVNRALIDKAIMYPIQFDISDLQTELHSFQMDKMKDAQLAKDKKANREERRALREKARVEKEEKLKQQKIREEETKKLTSDTTSVDSTSGERNLRKRLQRGVLGLLDSDGEEIDETSVHSENVDNDVEENVETRENEEDESLEGSIILATTHDGEGKDMYHVFSINEHGEKVPLDITSDILEVLVRNQKARDAMEEQECQQQEEVAEQQFLQSEECDTDGNIEQQSIDDDNTIIFQDNTILPFEIEIEDTETVESNSSLVETHN